MVQVHTILECAVGSSSPKPVPLSAYFPYDYVDGMGYYVHIICIIRLHVIILTTEFLLLYLFQIPREFFSMFDVDPDHDLGESLCGNQTFDFFICRILS